MRRSIISLNGVGTVCVIAGALAGPFSLSSVSTPLERAMGTAGGIVFVVGLVLLALSLVGGAIRRRREALAARPAFEVTPPRDAV